MKTWIIERGINEAAESMAAAAESAGCPVVRWEEGIPLPRLDPTACVFLGSLNACADVPGVVGDPERLKLSSWLPAARDLSLNPDPVFTTVGEVTDLTLPWPRVFARPDSAMKPFAGRVLDTSALSPEALDHGFYYDDLALPIALAEAVEVGREWRFVAVDGALVASSGYVAEGREARVDPPPPEAEALAREACAVAPEPTVVIDVCETPAGAFRLVEYNLFSGADLYGCDPAAIVAALA